MTSRTTIGLSRRQVLAGLGTIGVASVGAGLGTTAYFSDEESFEDNSLMAGEFDLKVDWQQLYYGPDESGVYGSYGRPYVNAYPDSYMNDPTDPSQLYLDTSGLFNQYVEAVDGVQDPILSRVEIADANGLDLDDPAVEQKFRSQFTDVPDYFENNELPALVELDDVKPGDEGEVCFSLHLFDNPGYIWLTGELLENAENGFSEPEADDPDEDGTDVGELADTVQVDLVYVDRDGQYPEFDEEVLWSGTLADAFVTLDGMVPLDGDPRTPDVRDCFPNSTTAYLCFRWSLPVDHANEVQTDSVRFTIGFYAEQCRHNDGSGPESSA